MQSWTVNRSKRKRTVQGHFLSFASVARKQQKQDCCSDRYYAHFIDEKRWHFGRWKTIFHTNDSIASVRETFRQISSFVIDFFVKHDYSKCLSIFSLLVSSMQSLMGWHMTTGIARVATKKQTSRSFEFFCSFQSNIFCWSDQRTKKHMERRLVVCLLSCCVNKDSLY